MLRNRIRELVRNNPRGAKAVFLRNFTTAQDAATRHLIGGICLRTQITRITGQIKFASKACPGFNVSQLLKGA